MAKGAPLWFMGGTLAAWTAARVAMLLPADLPAAADARAVTPRPGKHAAHHPPPTAGPPRSRHAVTIVTIASRPLAPARIARPVASPDLTDVVVAQPAVAGMTARRDLPAVGRVEQTSAVLPPMSVLAHPHAEPSRVAGDVWLVMRPGGGDSLAFGQLGASQGGARVTYALDMRRRAALSARLSSPISGRGAEAGVGVDLRPTSLPVHLLVEERFGLDRGGARPAAGVIAGTSSALPGRVRLDTYAQGGAVWRRGGFVDGAALLARPVLERGGMRVEIGGGAWGAAQRRVSRLDFGPSAAFVIPAAGTALRLQADYRFRLRGHARPGSGPALTLGGSF